MSLEYCQKAIEKAEYKKLDDGTWYAEVAGFKGVWENAKTVEDCRKIMADAQEQETLIQQERHAIFEYIERMHQDILHNFDRRVRRIRKKRKIILADEASRDSL
jgi:predicted RNase H-like HicB family nuclease